MLDLALSQNQTDRRSSAIRVLRIVCKTFGVSSDDLMIGNRRNVSVTARSIFCYVCYHQLGFSMPDLARLLGAKSHTFMVGIKKNVGLWVADNKVLPTNKECGKVLTSDAIKWASWAATDYLPTSLYELMEYPSEIREVFYGQGN